MHEKLNFLVCSNKHLNIAYLNDNDWNQIESMIILLESIFKTIKIFFSSSYLTISDI